MGAGDEVERRRGQAVGHDKEYGEEVELIGCPVDPGEVPEGEIGRAWRCGGTERVVTCEAFEFERVVSCSASGQRRRTELDDLVASEPFGDGHFPTADGAKPEIGCGGGSFLDGLGLWLWCWTEQLKTDGQHCGTLAMSEEAEVPDAHETFRQDVQ